MGISTFKGNVEPEETDYKETVELTHQMLVSSTSVGQTWFHFNLQQNTPSLLRMSLSRLRMGSFGRDMTVS